MRHTYIYLTRQPINFKDNAFPTDILVCKTYVSHASADAQNTNTSAASSMWSCQFSEDGFEFIGLMERNR